MKPNEKMVTNGLTELVATMKVANTITGGSMLAGYDTVAWNNNYSLLTLNRMILTYLYTSSGIIQTAIDLPTQDALSRGIEIESPQMSADDIDELLDFMEKTDQWTKLRQAWNWGRLYGGAALIVNTNQDPEKPMDYRRLDMTPIEFYDVDRWQISSGRPYIEGYDQTDEISDAESWLLFGQPIHKSRVLTISGRRAPYYVRRQLRGWGMSEAERMIPPLNLYLKTQNVLYEILDEAKIDVYRMKDLAAKLATAASTANIERRVQLTNELKSVTNAILLDAQDEFEQKTMSFGGLAEVMGENRIGISAALRMPMTKLFGLSASGFNTGESDLENYNLMIESDIRMPMKPIIRKMVEINMFHLWGRKAPFSLKWPSLRVLSALEEEQVKDSKFNRATVAYEKGLIDSEEWGQIMQNEGIISINTRAADGLLPEQPTPPEEPGKAGDDGQGAVAGEQMGINTYTIRRNAQTKQDKKIARVMREFSDGKLKDSHGKTVTDRDQALAIAYSEARKNAGDMTGIGDKETLKSLSKKHNLPLMILKREFRKGLKVEAEHTQDPDVAAQIAMDHLTEDGKYYSKLATIEGK